VEPLIAAIPADKGILFDGIPRRLGQAEFLVNFLGSQGRSALATVLIEVQHEESLKRLLLRAEKEGRADDTKEAIEYRLQQYRNETEPMLPFLEERSSFFRVDGVGSIEEIAERIGKELGS
jgi:adenylate kinase